jgi:hypothetical protein
LGGPSQPTGALPPPPSPPELEELVAVELAEVVVVELVAPPPPPWGRSRSSASPLNATHPLAAATIARKASVAERRFHEISPRTEGEGGWGGEPMGTGVTEHSHPAFLDTLLG